MVLKVAEEERVKENERTLNEKQMMKGNGTRAMP
jgi:hypothetical protein